MLIPMTIALAIFRYRLWAIELVVRRTVVYGLLVGLIIGLYVVLVGGLGHFVGGGENVLLSILATGLIAVLFHPLRLRLQQGVNRLLYGERDDPIKVLSQLGQRLEAAIAPEAVLLTIVETVAQALKLPYAAIALKRTNADQFEIEAEVGQPTADLLNLPLTYQSEIIGQLQVAPRSVGESFSPADRRLLTDIAHQAGAAVHAVRLTADLQRSRERLVTAREEERRRLRRDLHDGLGPQLASLSLTVDAAVKLLDRDPETARDLLQALKDQAQEAVLDIRRVVYELRPPALDDLGLIEALREHAARYKQNGLLIDIDAPARLPSLPAAVEVAAYRIIQEAVTNIIRHAGAHHCQIRLQLDDTLNVAALNLEIQDDGVGLPRELHPGIGLNSMRERAAELGGRCEIENRPGGGTCVAAWLPLGQGVEQRGS
jgi:signal transduction histidine kinase